MAYDRIAEKAETLLRDKIPSDGRRISGEVVAAAARQGDQVAREILRSAGYYAGVGLSIIIQVLNPELIVVGGGLTRIGPLVMEPALMGLREHTQPELLDSARIEPWQLGDDLGIIGAAAKVFSLFS
jgi:glucokinase